MSVLQFILDHGVELAITVAAAIVIIRVAWDLVS